MEQPFIKPLSEFDFYEAITLGNVAEVTNMLAQHPPEDWIQEGITRALNSGKETIVNLLIGYKLGTPPPVRAGKPIVPGKIGQQILPVLPHFKPIPIEFVRKLPVATDTIQIIPTATTTAIRATEKDNKDLVEASRKGNINEVKRLLAIPGINVNLQTKNGDTALSMASSRGHKGIVKMLLAIPGINVNLQTKNGETALMWASSSGHKGIVKMLLAIPGINVNLQTKNGDTALMWASSSGHKGIVKMLLAITGINVNLQTKNGDTALMWASSSGHKGIVKMLLAIPGINVNLQTKNGDTALIWASSSGHKGIVKMLLAIPGINVNLQTKNGETALMWASIRENKEIVKILQDFEKKPIPVVGIDHKNIQIIPTATTTGIRATEKDNKDLIEALDIYKDDITDKDEVKRLLAIPGINVNLQNKHGDTALMWASFYGHKDIVKMLLAIPGINVNLQDKYGDTALSMASSRGHKDIVKMLLAIPGINVNLQNKNGETALIIASSHGHKDIVKMLLAIPGINVNLQDKNGYTALMITSSRGHKDIVKMLLAIPGINVNLQSNYGETALMISSESIDIDIVKMLLDIPGINVNLQTKDGETALIIASLFVSTDIVKELLKAPGINVNLQNNNGYTALIWASRRENKDIVKELLAIPGINVNLQTKDGDTALMIASFYGHKDIVKILQDYKNIQIIPTNPFTRPVFTTPPRRQVITQTRAPVKIPPLLPEKIAEPIGLAGKQPLFPEVAPFRPTGQQRVPVIGRREPLPPIDKLDINTDAAKFGHIFDENWTDRSFKKTTDFEVKNYSGMVKQGYDPMKYLMSRDVNTIGKLVDQDDTFFGFRGSKDDMIQILWWSYRFNKLPSKIPIFDARKLAKLSHHQLVRLVGQFWPYQKDKATIVFALTKQVDMFDIGRSRPTEYKRYPDLIATDPTKIYNLAVYIYRYYGGDLGTPSFYSPYRHIANSDKSILEGFILQVDQKNLNDMIKQVQMILPPRLKTNRSKLKYFKNTIREYEPVFTRRSNYPKPIGYPKDPVRKIKNILVRNTDAELVTAYEIDDFHDRRDLLDRSVKWASVSKPTWSYRKKYCVNDDRKNYIMYDDRDKNDPTDPILSYGIPKSYRCYQTSELDAFFREYEEGGTKEKIFMFRSPDWKRGDTFDRSYTIESIKQLQKLLQDKPRRTKDENDLLKKIQDGLANMKSSFAKLSELRNKFNSLNTAEKQKVLNYMSWIFIQGMRMRFWKGPGNPYPEVWEEGGGGTMLCTPTNRNKNVNKGWGERTRLLEVLKPDTEEWVLDWPRFRYNFISAELKLGKEKFNFIAHKAMEGQFCLAEASEHFLGLGWVLLTDIARLNLKQLNQTLAKFINTPGQPPFNPKNITRTGHTDPDFGWGLQEEE